MFLVGFRVQKKCNSKFHIIKDISPAQLYFSDYSKVVTCKCILEFFADNNIKIKRFSFRDCYYCKTIFILF